MSKQNKLNEIKDSQIMLKALEQDKFINQLPLIVFESKSISQIESTDPKYKVDQINKSGYGIFKPSLKNFAFMSPTPINKESTPNNESFTFRIGYSAKKDFINPEINEVISLILFVGPESKPIGNFKITAIHTTKKLYSHTIDFSLDYITFSKRHKQNKLNSLVLTGGAIAFFNTLMECIVLSGTQKDRFTFNINQQNENDSGEKIGNIIFLELDSAMNSFKSEHPEKAGCIVPLKSK